MKRPDILDYQSSQRDKYFDDLEKYCDHLESLLKSASQPNNAAEPCKHRFSPTHDESMNIIEVCSLCGMVR